jgi:hypothetical protein
MKHIRSCFGSGLGLFFLFPGLVGGGASGRSIRMAHMEQHPVYNLGMSNLEGPGADRKSGLRSSNATLAPTLMPSPPIPEQPCKPKRLIDRFSFSVDRTARPMGKMGDVDDVTIDKKAELVRFKYTTSGKGSHEWDYKYEASVLSPNPAQFAGVMYLDPDSDFGTRCAGYDLTGMRVVRWKARSVGQGAVVEFRIGGLKWIWDSHRRVKVDPPYPDSLPSMSLGVSKLDNKWRDFQFKLPKYPDAYFSRVINVFSWVIPWRSNHVTLSNNRTAPARPRTFEIEIKDISYSAK